METQKTLSEQVQAVLQEALRVGAGEIGPQTQFGDLPQWDSMGHMEVMVALEKAFGVEITADTITELVSIPAICSYIEARHE
ncbi:MAG: acyl carrier protein [Anaerolineales bacterium]|nr:acyl carrier protein [Anaerolineales bacterium]